MRSPAKNSSPYYTHAGATPLSLGWIAIAVTPVFLGSTHHVRLRSTHHVRIALFTILQKTPGEKSVFSVGVFNSIGSPPTPLKKGGF